jgi:clorobiocin biosynthesis protein CloN5
LTVDDYIDPIRDYIVCNHLDGEPGLDRRTPLLEWGVIDSLALTDVLAFVEEEFDVVVPPSEMTPENLHDLETIGTLVAQLDAA